jgi:hypothetical protein
MQKKLRIIPTILQEQYNSLVSNNLEHEFQKLHDAEISTEHFSFYTSVSSVFSSKIEGEEIELDSYINHKKFGKIPKIGLLLSMQNNSLCKSPKKSMLFFDSMLCYY